MRTILDTLTRWRTWIVNVAFAALLTPDLLLALMGFDWGTIVPKQYMPFVTLGILVLNVWMRPRPAALKREVKARLADYPHENL